MGSSETEHNQKLQYGKHNTANPPKPKQQRGHSWRDSCLSPPGPPENCYQNFELIAIAFLPPPPLAILLPCLLPAPQRGKYNKGDITYIHTSLSRRCGKANICPILRGPSLVRRRRQARWACVSAFLYYTRLASPPSSPSRPLCSCPARSSSSSLFVCLPGACGGIVSAVWRD